MVGAAGVVADAFRRVRAEEDGAGVGNLRQQRARRGGVDDEVFRRVGVADGDGLVKVGGEDAAAVRECFGSRVGARQGGQLSRQFAFCCGDERGTVADEDDL